MTDPSDLKPQQLISAVPGTARGIDALVEAVAAAWAAKDAAAYAASYAIDAEFLNPFGGILVGRDAIRAQHAFLFSGPFAPSTLTLVVRRTVFLTGITAVVDVDFTLTGFVGLPPGLPSTEPGLNRTRVKWLVEKRGSSWEILAQQMTQVLPVP